MTITEGASGGREAGTGAAGRGPGRRRGSAPHSRRKPKRKKRLARIAMGLGAFVVLVAGAGLAWIYQLDGNIKHGALDSAATKPQKGKVIPGVLNILVIGSDTRTSKLDTSLGGSDNSLPHADVEMLVHVSADHNNATVLSIPRDTDVQMPACKDHGKTYSFPAHDQITNSMNYGPGCTVAAVNQLTGVNITHYMVVDFGGVVSMSDAVGGVQVCVNHNVYDPGSHLKLPAGTHTLKGQAALEWLRTRHAFGLASDIQRTETQHLFLSALIHKMKSAGTLTDPQNIFSLAEAASHAFMVDDKLDGVSNLISLANTLAGIPTKHITFATMPSTDDPWPPEKNAWVAPRPSAYKLFDAIANDQSLTPSSTAPSAHPASPTHAAAATVDPASVPIHVLNGTSVNGSLVPGRAGAVRTELSGKGYTDTVVGDTSPVTSTKVRYSTADPAYKREAQQVAAALGLPSSSLDPTGTHSSIYLLVGPDLKLGAGSAPDAKPSVDIRAATVNAATENAGAKVACAQATPWKLEALPADLASWDGLTVEQAYARATREGIPDSDKTK